MKIIFKSIFVFLLFNISFLQGQTLQELENLKNEYEDALKRQSLQKSPEVSEAEKTVKSTVLPDKLVYSRKDVESLLINTSRLLEELQFLKDSTVKMPNIGYETFTQRDTIPFWQNLPIPKDYILGPGDEIIISIWGETNSYISQKINREGEIFIENIGILNFSDKNLQEAKDYTISKFSRVYSTLSGRNPKSFIDLSIGELKSVNIHFVGFVNIPGVHMIHPFSSIVSGITQAGGVDYRGSLRSIEVIRDNNKILTFDLYDYLFSGKSATDIRLRDQDIIFVPPRKSKIALNGQISKAGYYEIINNETLDDLINFSGGRLSNASDELFVYNPSSQNSSRIIQDNFFSSYEVLDGDSIYVAKKPEINRYVRIEGQVKNSGIYPFEDKMTLNRLIDATMTLNDKDFMNTVNLTKININRVNPLADFPLVLKVNSLNEEIELQNGDHITVPRNKYYRNIESVIITGEITAPGIYPVNNLTTLDLVINAAGGLTDFALKHGIEIFRDSLKIGWNDEYFPLFDGDSLHVLKKSGLVMVKGEVNNSGYFSYKKGDSIQKYIRRAGGVSAFAEPRDIFIIYPNGISAPKSGIRRVKVLEGSTIVVNPRTIAGSSKGPSRWEIFGTVASQTGNIATTLLSLILISSQANGN